MRMAIIGAGVAGGIIGRGLLGQPGIDLTLVDAAGADDHRLAGNGLNIGPNAMQALHAVLPGIARELEAASLPWRRWYGCLASGQMLFDTPLEQVASGPGIRITWSTLYRIMREEIAGRTLYGTRFAGVSTMADGRLLVAVEDVASGERRELAGIDLLVAADGRYSPVRAASVGAAPVQQLGIANFRLLLDDDGATDIDDLCEWYHGANRLLAFRLLDGRIYLSGNFPLLPGADIAAEQKTPAWLRGAYLPPGLAATPAYRVLVDALCDPDAGLHWSRAQEGSTRFRDGSGRILFVGDAAHPMAPALGQGATQAIEDGCVLVALARMPGRGAAELAAAFEALRGERVAFAKRFSRDASAPLLLGADARAANAEKMAPDYIANLRRLYSAVPVLASAVAA